MDTETNGCDDNDNEPPSGESLQGVANYTEEQEYQSKMATEKGLIGIGVAMEEKRRLLDEMDKLVIEIKDNVSKLSDVDFSKKLTLYIDYNEKEKLRYKSSMEVFDDEYRILSEDTDELLLQLEKLELKEQKYWKPMVKNLKEKNGICRLAIHRRDTIIQCLCVCIISMYALLY